MYGIYDLIVITDLSGHLVSVNSKDSSGNKINSEPFYAMDFSNESWFKGVMNKNYTEDKSKGFEGVYFEDAQFNSLLEKAYGRKVYSTVFASFVNNEKGEPIGVISTHANFIWIENLLMRLSDEAAVRGMNSLEINLLNNKHNIIIDYDPSNPQSNKKVLHDENILNKFNLMEKNPALATLLQQGKEGVQEADHTRKKISQLVAYNRVHGPKIVDSIGWSILVREGKSEFYSQINKAKYTAICIFGIIFALIFAASLLFSRSLSRKMLKIGDNLTHDSKRLLETASGLSASSHELSAATIEQASSLQETVAAVTEINSPVDGSVNSIRDACKNNLLRPS